MGIVASLNLGVVAVVVMAVSICAAFLVYVFTFGRNSSIRQKNVVASNESIE